MKKLIAVAALAALVLAGCGGSDSGGDSDEDQVRATVSSFSDAVADGDFAAVCEMYSPETQAFFKETKDVAGDCEVLIKGTYGGLDEQTVEALGEVETIEVEGDTANVELGNGDQMVLQKVDGEWMLTLD